MELQWAQPGVFPGCAGAAALVRQLALAWAYNAGVVAFTVQLECQALFKLLPELGCRLSEFMHEYFKDRVYISYSPLALPGLSPIGFQSQLYGLIFPVLVPRAGMPNVELEPGSLDGLRGSLNYFFINVLISIPLPCIICVIIKSKKRPEFPGDAVG